MGVGGTSGCKQAGEQVQAHGGTGVWVGAWVAVAGRGKDRPRRICLLARRAGPG